MAKVSSLLDEVMAAVANARPGARSWFERLNPDAQAEILKAREMFDPATHQKRAFYKAMKAAAEKRGWHIPGEKQFTDWLRQR